MNNPTLKIAVCNRRTDKRYKNVERTWIQLKDRNRVPVRTTETAAEYPKLSREEKDKLKDQGGFVGGWLKEGIRKNTLLYPAQNRSEPVWWRKRQLHGAQHGKEMGPD